VTGEQELLRSAQSVLLVDWPSRDVPDTLAEAGYAVFVKNGPGPEDFNPAPPEHVDLVYCHRPLAATSRKLASRAASLCGMLHVWRR
jgi:hypothetical protein